MAALNLYRYAELFRSKDIKGVDLLSLDRDKLAVSFATFSLSTTVLFFCALGNLIKIHQLSLSSR